MVEYTFQPLLDFLSKSYSDHRIKPFYSHYSLAPGLTTTKCLHYLASVERCLGNGQPSLAHILLISTKFITDIFNDTDES